MHGVGDRPVPVLEVDVEIVQPSAAAVQPVHDPHAVDGVDVREVHLPPVLARGALRVGEGALGAVDGQLRTILGDVVVVRARLGGGLTEGDVGEGVAVLDGLEFHPGGAGRVDGANVHLACGREHGSANIG